MLRINRAQREITRAAPPRSLIRVPPHPPPSLTPAHSQSESTYDTTARDLVAWRGRKSSSAVRLGDPPLSRHAQVTWDESGDPPPVEPETLRACIPRDLRDRLVAAVREVAESPDAALFAQPVDVEDYPNLIPVPMDLGLIVRRLEKVRGRWMARVGAGGVYNAHHGPVLVVCDT